MPQLCLEVGGNNLNHNFTRAYILAQFCLQRDRRCRTPGICVDACLPGAKEQSLASSSHLSLSLDKLPDAAGEWAFAPPICKEASPCSRRVAVWS